VSEAAQGGGKRSSVRALILGALALALLAAAVWFNNRGQQIRGIVFLGFTFCVPMIWVVLAARETDNPDSPLRRFIPRIAAWLALGTAILGVFWWNVDRRITLMEAGFAAFYLAAAFIAVRIIDGKARKPRLIEVEGAGSKSRGRGRTRSR
jgi:hypothetical protein